MEGEGEAAGYEEFLEPLAGWTPAGVTVDVDKVWVSHSYVLWEALGGPLEAL